MTSPIGVILAGGLGTRMKDHPSGIPKALLPVDGRAILARQLDLYAAHGFREVVICAGHRAEFVEQAVREFAPSGLDVRFALDPFPAGTGGCVGHAFEHLTQPVLVMNGDVVIDLDLSKLMSFHQTKGAEATVVVHPNDHPHDSDLIEVSADGQVQRFYPKPHPDGLSVRNMVVAGVYVLQPSVVARIQRERAVDMVHDVLVAEHEQNGGVHAYQTEEYIKDMGTPGRYEAVCGDWARGRVARLSSGQARKTAFLDRDGTINAEVGLLSAVEKFRLIDGAAAAIRKLNKLGILTVVVTNQSVIARGMATEKELDQLHAHMEMLLGKEGAYVDRLYYCPHHPDGGYKGEVAALKIPCDCRKPSPGMLLSAAEVLNIDLPASAMFGDAGRDMQAGHRAGVTSYFLGPGRFEELDVPVIRKPDLASAVEHWLQQSGL
jgi:mannose-1-phosphate guanylyltransferase/phosphomannomutase